MRYRPNRRKQSLKERLEQARELTGAASRRILPLLALALVAVGVPFGMFKAYVHVVSSPYFAVEAINVRGVEHVSQDELVRRAGLVEGMNVFDVDVDRVKTLVEQHPWVARARVERRLPDQVSILVEEHVPTAVLVTSEGYVLVDRLGVPFKDLTRRDFDESLIALPFVTGLTRREAESVAGRALVLEAVDVARLYREAGLPMLSEIHVDPVMGLSLVPADSGIEIRLGRGRYEERIKRITAVLASLREEGRPVDYILVDAERELSRVTVGRRSGGMDAAADTRQ